MTKAKLLAPSIALAVALFGVGCGAPAAPFNQMPQSQVTVLQLQNYEPPAPVATATPGANPLGLPIALPPELSQMLGGMAGGGAAGGGAAGGVGAMAQPLCGLGIPFPGICGGGAAAPTTTPAANVQRFQGFRILGTAQLSSEDAKNDLAKILGKDGNFDTSNKPCSAPYPEYGISFGVPNNDLLLSFMCRTIDARTFAWPHPNRGLSDDTQKKIAGVFRELTFMPVQ